MESILAYLNQLNQKRFLNGKINLFNFRNLKKYNF